MSRVLLLHFNDSDAQYDKHPRMLKCYVHTTIAHYSPSVCVSPESLSDLFDEIVVVQIVQ